MAWLLCGDRRIPLEIASGPVARARGLLRRDGIDGALLLRPASSIHTLGMRFAIDVAYLDGRHRVVATATMAPNRVGRVRMGSRSVLEAEAGRFAEWGIVPGVTCEVHDEAAA